MKRLGVFLLPPGWDASPSQGYPSIKFAGTHLYTWVERGTVRVSVLPKNTTQCPRPRLEPGPLDPETSALTMRPPRLPNSLLICSNEHTGILDLCFRNTRSKISHGYHDDIVFKKLSVQTKTQNRRVQISPV